jgi:ABC-type sugar transport system substrate-binding protein
MMAIGAAMALKSAGTKPGSVLIAGVDGTPDGLNAISKGEMTVSVFQDAKGKGSARWRRHARWPGTRRSNRTSSSPS